MLIKFRWVDKGPCYKTIQSSGADLCSREVVVIAPGKTKTVPLGLWIESCNERVDIQLRARSSLFKKTGCILTNSVGTIDPDYRDEIRLSLLNLSDRFTIIQRGMAVAQLVIGPAHQVDDFERLDEERVGGFGSTDREEET